MFHLTISSVPDVCAEIPEEKTDTYESTDDLQSDEKH